MLDNIFINFSVRQKYFYGVLHDKTVDGRRLKCYIIDRIKQRSLYMTVGEIIAIVIIFVAPSGRSNDKG